MWCIIEQNLFKHDETLYSTADHIDSAVSDVIQHFKTLETRVIHHMTDHFEQRLLSTDC